MGLQTEIQINVDFSTQKYINIEAKQYDRNSRFILVTCYSNGELIRISNKTCSAYIRYRKPDEKGVFNTCEINSDGKIKVELTEQMLAVAGMCYLDLVVCDITNVNVDIKTLSDNTTEIINIGEAAILATMTFNVNVKESVFDNDEIESSYEYDALNDLLIESKRNYQSVMDYTKRCEVTTEGYMNTTEGYMDNTENCMNTTEGYMNTTNEYMNTTKGYMDTTQGYMNSANDSMTTTKGYMDTTKGYMDTTQGYMDNTNQSMTTTKGYMNTTEGYMNNAQSYMNTTKESMNTTKGYMDNTQEYMTTTQGYLSTTQEYMGDANEYMNAAQSYAIGGSGTRENEDFDNAKYYCQVVKNVVDGLNSGFIPMGTISFAELSIVEKATGFTYNINEDFITDDTFVEGTGKFYTAGTNVYYTANGQWDCFGGSASVTATIDEVKEYLNI